MQASLERVPVALPFVTRRRKERDVTAPPTGPPRRAIRCVGSERRVSRRQLAAGAFLALVLAGEVAGRWVVERVPHAGHAPGRHHGGVDAWPVLVILAKVAMALLLARLAWRLSRALRLARPRERVLRALGRGGTRPAPEVGLSPRAWLASFMAMSALYAIPTSSAEVANGCWPLLTPWLHTQAVPVFALLAVGVAILWRTVSRWLAAVERYADELGALVRSHRRSAAPPRPGHSVLGSPRSRFGVCFESRPPPAVA